MTIHLDNQIPAHTAPDWVMADVLQGRRWVLRQRPFRHVTAAHVFRDDVYSAIAASFRECVDNSSAMHYTEQHDFIGGPVTTDMDGPLSVFLSPAFHALFIDAFGVEVNGLANAGMHRHSPGSRSGFPHNDISPEELSVVLPPHEIASGGASVRSDGSTGKSVRAIAILFYLNNGPWEPGDGGGTGLYRHWSDPVTQPVSMAPPRDNTLLAFECSPLSYHAFISNRRRRDSVIVFLYRWLEDYLRQWGIDGTAQYADM